MPLIEIKNLTKTFKLPRKNVEVIRGINLEIKEGDFVLIYGPSGCGKTTLLNLILGLETPTLGEVKVKSHILNHLRPQERAAFRLKNFAMIFQVQIWLKSLNVLENVALPLYLRGQSARSAREKASEALTFAGMEKFAHSRPNELSSGEQQRISLARAMVVDAPIIIADEPTGNLDSTASDKAINFLDILNKRYGKTVILVTHNQSYWSLGSCQIEMKDGRIFTKPSKGRKS